METFDVFSTEHDTEGISRLLQECKIELDVDNPATESV